MTHVATHQGCPLWPRVLLHHCPDKMGSSLYFWLIYCLSFSGWEGIWNWGARLGKDQRFFLVACNRRLPQSHGQAPGGLGHAVGAVVWRREVLRGKAAAQPKTPSPARFCPLLRLAVGCGCAPSASQASPPSVQHSQALQVLMALASVTNDWPL